MHNVWSRPTLENGWGHRGINRRTRERLRKESHEFAHSFTVTKEIFATLITRLVDVYERVRSFEDMVKIPEYPTPEPAAPTS